MSKNRRNERFSCCLLTLLRISICGAVMYVKTADNCVRYGAKDEEYLSPGWVCGPAR
jgi:hypothetical protein